MVHQYYLDHLSRVAQRERKREGEEEGEREGFNKHNGSQASRWVPSLSSVLGLDPHTADKGALIKLERV